MAPVAGSKTGAPNECTRGIAVGRKVRYASVLFAEYFIKAEVVQCAQSGRTMIASSTRLS